jgi:hypothetical protein
MTRREFLERESRQIHGGFATDDSEMTYNLINSWLNDSIAIAAKKNYTDNLQLDGVGYVNNSFYTKFRGLSVSADGSLTYRITLPQIPIGIGSSEGVGTLQFIDANGRESFPCVPLSENQVTYFESMRVPPNITLYYTEGGYVYAKSTILLTQYTANVRMVSGGDSNDLDSVLNVPSDYFPAMVEYLKAQLAFEKAQPKDAAIDGKNQA